MLSLAITSLLVWRSWTGRLPNSFRRGTAFIILIISPLVGLLGLGLDVDYINFASSVLCSIFSVGIY